MATSTNKQLTEVVGDEFEIASIEKYGKMLETKTGKTKTGGLLTKLTYRI